MEGGPAVAGKSCGAGGGGMKQGGQLDHVWDGGSLKDIEREKLGLEDGEEEVADERLAAVDRPEQSGNALGIAPGGQGWVVVDGGGDIGGGSGLDEFEEGSGHGKRVTRRG